eukprot:5463863-Lingulodinium_polyedra.AAC.1
MVDRPLQLATQPQGRGGAGPLLRCHLAEKNTPEEPGGRGERMVRSGGPGLTLFFDRHASR